MVAGIGSSDDTLKTMMTQLFSKMNKADTDGTSGLSKDELSSVNAGEDVGGAAFLSSLEEQFDELDSDKDGQLSFEEISNAKPPAGPMGPPPGMSMGSSEGEDEEENSYSSLLDAISEAVTSSLDKNGDGVVSMEEILAAANSDDSSKNSEEASESGNSIKNLASNFLQKLISSYEDGGDSLLSSLTSVA